jgi:hypothetical protein
MATLAARMREGPALELDRLMPWLAVAVELAKSLPSAAAPAMRTPPRPRAAKAIVVASSPNA